MPLLQGETDEFRNWALYGVWGSAVNITDGQYTYMRATDADAEANCYSTKMINQWAWLVPETPKMEAESGEFLPYTDCPVWTYSDRTFCNHESSLLFDTVADPDQDCDLTTGSISEEERMKNLLIDALDEMEAPQNTYNRLDLEKS